MSFNGITEDEFISNTTTNNQFKLSNREEINTSIKNIQDVNEFNLEVAQKVKNPLSRNKKTYLPFSKTMDVYTSKKVPYDLKEDEKVRHFFVYGCNFIYSREVTRIYKIKSAANNNKVFIMWNEVRYGRTGLGNLKRNTVDCVGRYYDPEVDRTVELDQTTQQPYIRIGDPKTIVTRYDLEFDKKLVNELLEDAIVPNNPDSIDLYLVVEGRNQDMRVNLDEFLSDDFDAIYTSKVRQIPQNNNNTGVMATINSNKIPPGSNTIAEGLKK